MSTPESNTLAIAGKVVAITGASSGIGEATARLLAERGAKVMLGARRTERLAVGDSAAFAGDIAHGYATPADAAVPARFALTVFQPHVTGSRP